MSARRDTPAELGEKVAALAFEHGARRIGMIVRTSRRHHRTPRTNPAATLVDLNGAYQGFRLVKTPAERPCGYRLENERCGGRGARDELRPGVNEYQVPRIIEDVYNAHRGWNLIHFSMSTPMDAPDLRPPPVPSRPSPATR